MAALRHLIVPIILTTGSLHFAEVQEDSIAQDVINTLIASEEVRNEVLGDLDDRGWALQKIRVQDSGRLWEEGELEALGDGKVIMMLAQNCKQVILLPSLRSY